MLHYFCTPIREHSSAGSEHLPYKQAKDSNKFHYNHFIFKEIFWNKSFKNFGGLLLGLLGAYKLRFWLIIVVSFY